MSICSAFPRSHLIASVLLLALGCSKGADQKDQQGIVQLRLGQPARAYQYLLNARNRQPNNSDIRLDLATYYLLAANADQAREEALTVLDKDSSNLRALRLYAASAVTRDDADLAAARLEASRDKVEKDTAARFALASLYLRKGDTARAKEAGGGVSNFGASASSSPVSRALDYIAVGRRDDAKRILREAVQSDPSAVGAARILALASLSDGNADEALSVLAPVLSKDSADAEALMARGEAHLVQKQSEEAIKDLQSVLAHDAKLAQAHFDMAVAHMQSANAARATPARDSALESANRELRAALKLTPNYPEAVFQLGALRIQVGAPNDAIGDLEHFVADNPRSVRGRTLLGSALLASGRAPEAGETFHEVLKISPHNAEAHFWIGTMLARAGKRTEAEAQFDTAATISPTFLEAINQLAQLLIADRNGDAAAARVKKQIDMAPPSAPLHVLLGAIDEARNDTSGAEAAFLKASRIDPRILDPHLRLAELYIVAGKFDEALPHALEALKLDSNNARAKLVAGTAYQQRGDVVKAREQYENLLKTNPRDGGAANNLAILLSDQGDLDGGLKYATLAQQLSPNDPHIADTLGWILYRRRSFDAAAKFLRGSAALLPESPTVNYHLGMVAQQLGDLAAARQALTKAVSSAANFAGKDEARKALAQLK